MAVGGGSGDRRVRRRGAPASSSTLLRTWVMEANLSPVYSLLVVFHFVHGSAHLLVLAVSCPGLLLTLIRCCELLLASVGKVSFHHPRPNLVHCNPLNACAQRFFLQLIRVEAFWFPPWSEMAKRTITESNHCENQANPKLVAAIWRGVVVVVVGE